MYESLQQMKDIRLHFQHYSQSQPDSHRGDTMRLEIIYKILYNLPPNVFLFPLFLHVEAININFRPGTQSIECPTVTVCPSDSWSSFTGMPIPFAEVILLRVSWLFLQCQNLQGACLTRKIITWRKNSRYSC